MLCVIPYHSGDVRQAHNLLQFIGELGGCKQHECLLVADADTPFIQCAKAKKMAEQSFAKVMCISNYRPFKGAIDGPNSLFWATAEYVQAAWPKPWLWLEPDCVPLKRGWLDDLEVEYTGIDTVMGDLYGGLASDTGTRTQAVSPIAVYPPNAASLLVQSERARWDITNRDWLLQNAVPTPLIKHFYGRPNLPPTFVKQRKNGNINQIEVSQLRPKAVLFHRCKDGSLVNLIRNRLGIKSESLKILIVYVCVPHRGKLAYEFAERFVNSYRTYKPTIEHEVVAVCNGQEPQPNLRKLFNEAGFYIYSRNNEGFDIGAYQEIARNTDATLQVCFGESVYFYKLGWLERILDAAKEGGKGIYGVYGSKLVRPHLITTAFAISPQFLRDYKPVKTKGERYMFEHGFDSIWRQVHKAGGAAKLVTWDGEYDEVDWRKPRNILWRGDQSNCLLKCNHTDRYEHGDAKLRDNYEKGADGKMVGQFVLPAMPPRKPKEPMFA